MKLNRQKICGHCMKFFDIDDIWEHIWTEHGMYRGGKNYSLIKIHLCTGMTSGQAKAFKEIYNAHR